MGACTEATLAPHAACYEFQCLFTRTDGSRLLGCEPILTQSAVGSSSSAPCGSSAQCPPYPESSPAEGSPFQLISSSAQLAAPNTEPAYVLGTTVH